jgi:ferric-dicitrate binding protein FerR (iron transport regulator)
MHPEQQLLMDRAVIVVKSFRLKIDKRMDKAVSEELLDRIIIHHQNHKGKEIKTDQNKSINKYVKGKDRPIWVLAAACLAVIITFIFPLVFNSSDESVKEEAVQWFTKSTAPGVKSIFYLPDGTMVKLNSSSEISFPENFSDSVRLVKLSGQGYFDVHRDENLPFIVQAEHFQVQVLGTSFDIKSYPRNEEHNVVVLTGEVAVKTEFGEYLNLLPTEMLRFNEADGKILKKNVNLEKYTGWKDGIIIFQETPYQEVFEVLSEWYGVEFYLSNEINWKGTYSGKYENESLKNILLGIAYSKNIDFKLNNKKVDIFKPK